MGVYEVAKSIGFDGQNSFKSESHELSDWKIEGDDAIYGRYKVQDNLFFLQVFEAGHRIASYSKISDNSFGFIIC
jgi:hypothetical protein